VSFVGRGPESTTGPESLAHTGPESLAHTGPEPFAGRDSVPGAESVAHSGSDSIALSRSVPVGAAVASSASELSPDPSAGSVTRSGGGSTAGHWHAGGRCRRSLPRHLLDGAARGGGGGAPS
jgi:hypothetical protein